MRYRADKQVITAHTDGRTDGRTDTQTDAGNDNTRRPKLASGKNYSRISKWLMSLNSLHKLAQNRLCGADAEPTLRRESLWHDRHMWLWRASIIKGRLLAFTFIYHTHVASLCSLVCKWAKTMPHRRLYFTCTVSCMYHMVRILHGLFNKQIDVLPQGLVKSRSCDIWV